MFKLWLNLTVVIVALTATGCAKDRAALDGIARVAILEEFGASYTNLMSVIDVITINRSDRPPLRHKQETGEMWEYFAVSAKVVFKEPTYKVIHSRRIDPVNNRYRLVVKEVTPDNYEGIITGKIRLLKGGDYVSGFYPDGLIGVEQNGYGKFLGSFNPTGENIVRIINSHTATQVHPQAAPRKIVDYHEEFRTLKSEIDDNLDGAVIVGEF